MERIAIMYYWILFFILLGGCAFDLMHVKQIPVKIESAQVQKSFLLETDVDVKLDTGYSRLLKKGSRWNFLGSLSYGDIFKSDDQVLTVEASNIHEAYIVVKSIRLVGFYLPVEKTFSPLTPPVTLPMKEIKPTTITKGGTI
jgi:hypothetical protein